MLEVRNCERKKDWMRLFEVIVWSLRDLDVELRAVLLEGDRVLNLVRFQWIMACVLIWWCQNVNSMSSLQELNFAGTELNWWNLSQNWAELNQTEPELNWTWIKLNLSRTETEPNWTYAELYWTGAELNWSWIELELNLNLNLNLNLWIWTWTNWNHICTVVAFPFGVCFQLVTVNCWQPEVNCWEPEQRELNNWAETWTE